MLLSKGERNQIRDAMLDAGVWEIGKEETFASGKRANNKLHAERFKQNDPDGYERLIGYMADLILPHEPQGVWGPPSFGQEMAEDVGRRLALPVIYLEKDLKAFPAKLFLFRGLEDRGRAQSLERLAAVEDVPNEFTSIGGGLLLPGLGEHTVVAVGAWSRGDPFARQRIAPIPVEVVVDETIPNIIRPHDNFYWRHKAVAVGDGL